MDMKGVWNPPARKKKQFHFEGVPPSKRGSILEHGNMDTITFKASIFRISSRVDGGIRVEFDVPETELASICSMLLMRGIVLDVSVSPEKS